MFICLPAEHQTRSEMPVHSRIELEYGNGGSWGEGKIVVPGKNLSEQRFHDCTVFV